METEMPYKSEAQRKFFHTKTAKKKGITEAMVKEYDSASAGKKLPKKVGRHNSEDQKFINRMKGK